MDFFIPSMVPSDLDSRALTTGRAMSALEGALQMMSHCLQAPWATRMVSGVMLSFLVFLVM